MQSPASLLRRRLELRSERGQTIVLVVLLMPVLLGFSGLVLDVGHAYSVQRKLQATADAAALAGAAALQNGIPSAVATAASYGAKPGEANALGTDPVSESVTTKCLVTFPGCTGANAVVVNETATVSTVFAKVLGVNSFSVHAKSTACSPCGTRPLNIALVVDRTGSMQGNMSDLRAGVDTFLQTLNSSLDWVSLLVLPPAPGGSGCTAAADGAFPYQGSSYPTTGDNAYAVVHQSHDYLTGTALNPSSQLVQQVNCMVAQGGTAYKQALTAAQAELASFPASRSGYPNVIVFETDGAANTAPDSWFNHSSPHTQKSTGVVFYPAATGHSTDILDPCGSAVNYASTLKSSGVTVMTVGYNTTQDNDCYEAPYYTGSGFVSYKAVRETGTSAATALTNMASANDAYSATDASEMQAAFASIANKISGSANLVDNSTP
ncbi:MAG TPA: vWA domain-containing protein [Gaiellaceae bacterium]|nr:vWA domain-containing protein [Gaiellaceae bacterium]